MVARDIPGAACRLRLVAAVVLQATDNRVALQGFQLGQLAPREAAALRWQLVGANNARSLAGNGFGEIPSFADPVAAGSFGVRPRRPGFCCSLPAVPATTSSPTPPGPRSYRPAMCAALHAANQVVAVDAESVVTIRDERPNTLGDSEY
jgi:hypothetical protein